MSCFLFRLLHRAAHRRGECAAFISQHLLCIEAAAVHCKTRDLFSAALCLECKLCVVIIVFYLKYLYDALIRRQHAHFSVKRCARLRERALYVFERAAFQRCIAAFQKRFAALLRCVGVDHASGHCLRQQTCLARMQRRGDRCVVRIPILLHPIPSLFREEELCRAALRALARKREQRFK